MIATGPPPADVLDDHAAARPIVIGVDASARARDAVVLGRLLAEMLGAPIDLVSVHPYTVGSSRVGGEGWTAMTPARAEESLAQATRELGDRGPVKSWRLPASSPVLGLDLAAEEAEAEMIVIGSTGRGAVGRLLPGTTAEQLFAHARFPVGVAPLGYGSHRDGAAVVGVAYDDARESKEALAFAARLAARPGTTLRLIGVFDPAAYGGPGVAGRYGEPADAEQARDRTFARLERAAAEVGGESRFLEGRPAALLTKASQDVDLMVVGSHRRGLLRRALLGSVSAHLAEHAACPVVVVPRGALISR